MRRPRGLSVLETLLGVLLLFLATLYLFSMFASGQRFALRGREYTAATFLAHNRMEELVAAPADVLAPSTGGFPPPHEDYRYQVDISDFEGDLKVVEVVVTSPRGARARLRTLRRTTSFFGVDCDPATERVVAAVRGQPGTRIVQEGKAEQSGPAVPAGTSPGLPSGIVGHAGLGFMWVVDQDNGRLAWFQESGTGAWGAGEAVSPPGALAPEAPRFAGISTDGFGNRVFVADRANRGLWVLNDATHLGGRTWMAGSPYAPSDPALGAPAGVAVTATGSEVWVADTESQGLRRLLVNPSTAPYPAVDFEAEPGLGYWSRTLYRPPDGMGSPQGVAANPWGSTVVTVDSSDVLILQFVPRASGGYDEVWTRIPLDPALASALPSGLCFDPFRSVVYVNTRTGELWKLHLGPPPTFSRLAGGS